jgi:hypothetical protein
VFGDGGHRFVGRGRLDGGPVEVHQIRGDRQGEDVDGGAHMSLDAPHGEEAACACSSSRASSKMPSQ